MLAWVSYKLGSRQEGENINNLRFADDITLMAESKEELKSLLMRVKEDSERAGLRLNIKKKSFYLEIISDLQKSCRNTTWNSHIPFTQLPLNI